MNSRATCLSVAAGILLAVTGCNQSGVSVADCYIAKDFEVRSREGHPADAVMVLIKTDPPYTEFASGDLKLLTPGGDITESVGCKTRIGFAVPRRAVESGDLKLQYKNNPPIPLPRAIESKSMRDLGLD